MTLDDTRPIALVESLCAGLFHFKSDSFRCRKAVFKDRYFFFFCYIGCTLWADPIVGKPTVNDTSARRVYGKNHSSWHTRTDVRLLNGVYENRLSNGKNIITTLVTRFVVLKSWPNYEYSAFTANPWPTSVGGKFKLSQKSVEFSDTVSKRSFFLHTKSI